LNSCEYSSNTPWLSKRLKTGLLPLRSKLLLVWLRAQPVTELSTRSLSNVYLTFATVRHVRSRYLKSASLTGSVSE